jgi:hypothetical protein
LAETLVHGSADPEQVREAARIFASQDRAERAIETLRQGILTHPVRPTSSFSWAISCRAPARMTRPAST